jgi:hypothetical protein
MLVGGRLVALPVERGQLGAIPIIRFDARPAASGAISSDGSINWAAIVQPVGAAEAWAVGIGDAGKIAAGGELGAALASRGQAADDVYKRRVPTPGMDAVSTAVANWIRDNTFWGDTLLPLSAGRALCITTYSAITALQSFIEGKTGTKPSFADTLDMLIGEGFTGDATWQKGASSDAYAAWGSQDNLGLVHAHASIYVFAAAMIGQLGAITQYDQPPANQDGFCEFGVSNEPSVGMYGSVSAKVTALQCNQAALATGIALADVDLHYNQAFAAWIAKLDVAAYEQSLQSAVASVVKKHGEFKAGAGGPTGQINAALAKSLVAAGVAQHERKMAWIIGGILGLAAGVAAVLYLRKRAKASP